MSTTADNARPCGAAREGARGAASLLPAIAPLGFALGVGLGDMGTPRAVSWLSAPLLLAGSSQVVLIGELSRGATVLAAAAAAVAVNARFLLYGAALAERFAAQPRWFRWLAPHYIVDQTYGLVTARVSAERPPHEFRRYFVTAGTTLWLLWTLSVGAGVLAGPMLPRQVSLEFVLPSMFVALLVPGLMSRREVAMAAGGAGIGASGLPPLVSLLAIVVLAAVASGIDARQPTGARS